jgi:hypothetical protein
MGFFGKKKQAILNTESTLVPLSQASPSSSMRELEKLFQSNSIDYSLQGEGENCITYRDKRFMPFFGIEVTQLFNNAGCAMTYLCKQWRQNPFAPGDLGNIDISVSDEGAICVSAILPLDIQRYLSFDEGATNQIVQQVEILIAQGQSGMMRDIGCYKSYLGIAIQLPFELTVQKSPAETVDDAFAIMQLFALEVHRIFGSILTASNEPEAPPKSNVTYTPDAWSANGGYFVYGAIGSLWWLVDANFKFQSIVGEGAWKEHQAAEADGLPLTATDYDNLYRYENGMVYLRDGRLQGRYYAERYDAVPQFQKAEALFNTFQPDNMLTGFRTMCDLYFLFPESEPLFEEIAAIVTQARDIRLSGGGQQKVFAEACLMWLDEFRPKCPPGDRIRQL